MITHTLQLTGNCEETIIVIHINEKLDKQKRSRIESQVLKVIGILDVKFDKLRPQLLIVKHIPAVIRISEILKLLIKHKLHAQLVVGI